MEDLVEIAHRKSQMRRTESGRKREINQMKKEYLHFLRLLEPAGWIETRQALSPSSGGWKSADLVPSEGSEGESLPCLFISSGDSGSPCPSLAVRWIAPIPACVHSAFSPVAVF